MRASRAIKYNIIHIYMFIYEKDTEDVQTLSIYKYKVVANVKDYSYIDPSRL